MLILTRKPGESLYIGDEIKITIVELKGNQIRVGIDAPSNFKIYREEIYVQILEENKKAAEAAAASSSGLEGLSEAWKGRKVDAGDTVRKSSGGLTAMRSLKVGSEDPQVVVKRKKTKQTDE
jgi:carbon storage regulator